ncbi:S1 family peptidase [Streptomyces sp. DH37]|uniref:S1 family peptidase n=1 Tax=Streptomyces sp. DH37 TaxID=3040122 RepID=UPI0024431D98|nr:S1 family peptidase [Streptomyces sp. DH37]MDG9705390.1 S1 family peptidase [Streptomyces sp. DH37]
MKHRRTLTRRIAIAGAGVAALLSGPLAPASADTPSPAPRPLTPAAAGELASTLEGDLKNDMAGAYYDAGARTLVVNVLSATGAEKVRRAGAEPRIVRYSLARLGTVQKDLAAKSVPGTARAVDHRLNKVVVTADSTVRGDALADLRKRVAERGDTAVLKRSEGRFAPLALGGDAIWRGDGARCSLGFNVVRNGMPYFLTAGHCAELFNGWSTTRFGRVTGVTVASDFPGDDHALVQYTARTDHPSRVNLYDGSSQPIARAADPIVGQEVRRSGSTTRVRDGEVTALNVSVTYPQGRVDGLIQTTVCAEPGDSGGPLFSGDTGHGLTSGGSGNCSSGGTTFYQPLTEALRDYGARLG